VFGPSAEKRAIAQGEIVTNVCPECGYNAGENGEKILQLHISAQHGANSPKFMTPEQVAKIRLENDVVIARTFLFSGGLAVLLGLGIALYGYNVYATLTCNPNPFACSLSQSLSNQIAFSGFQSVYAGSQETVYGGLILFAIGFMGIAYWVARGLEFATRIVIVLLVGVFLLVLVTGLAIAGGIIPFGQRLTPLRQLPW
jgi:hypothetical protein